MKKLETHHTEKEYDILCMFSLLRERERDRGRRGGGSGEGGEVEGVGWSG